MKNIRLNIIVGLVMVVLSLIIAHPAVLGKELPKEHKACKNACTLAVHSAKNFSWHGWSCEEYQNKDTSFFCLTIRKF